MFQNRITAPLLAIAFVSILWSGNSSAAIACEQVSTTNNYMVLESPPVSSCLGAGEGNINGNEKTDDFLKIDTAGYSLASKSDGANPFSITYTQSVNTKDLSFGTWSIDTSFWENVASGAIGFKFGTGNEPDEWFVYELVFGETGGDWTFYNVNNKGGGLSHMVLYSTPVPLPAGVWLLITALGGLIGIDRFNKKLQRSVHA